jgi:hypothetical protein
MQTLNNIIEKNTQRAEVCSQVRAIVRYADPSTWPIADAVFKLLQANHINYKDEGLEIGMILVGDAGPSAAIQSVAESVQAGRISPMHFAAANAGAAIGICCTAFNFHGPTLAITLPVKTGKSIAEMMASRWLNDKSAKIMIIVTYENIDGEISANASLNTE